MPTDLPNTNNSRVVPGLITGGVIFLLVVMFIFFVVYKFRNSKKNTAATPGQNGTEGWALTHTNKAESVASDDHAKSSVSTYISAMTRNTEPSFYDRNNVTGASSSSALTDFSRLPLDPPPSPVTERALSTMTDANKPFQYFATNHCGCSDAGHDAPPPTLASTALLDDVDMYCPMQHHNWPVSNNMSNMNGQHSHKRHRKNRHSNHRAREPHYRFHNGGIRYSDDQLNSVRNDVGKQWLAASQNIDPHYDNGDPYYMEAQKALLLFDPPPTPCTNYLSDDDDRPRSPTNTEPSIVFNILHEGDHRTHFAPPPSPTSQL